MPSVNSPHDPLPKEIKAGPFSAPWQARVFALTVGLNEAGLFTWQEWVDVFSPEILQADAAQDASDYYHRWATSLVTLLNSKALLTEDLLAQITQSWKRAAHATPHGTPILRENDPLFSG